MFKKPVTRAPRHILIKPFFLAIGRSYLRDLSHTFWKRLSIFTVLLTIKTSSQNISITLSQIPLKLHEHRGGCWRKTLTWTILQEQFAVRRNTAASKIDNGVISLLWQLRCHCNPDRNKFSSLSNASVVAIFPNICQWDVVYAQAWEVLTLKKSIEPP